MQQKGKTLKMKTELKNFIRDHCIREGMQDFPVPYERQPDKVKNAMDALKKFEK